MHDSTHLRDNVDSWTLVQNQITFLDCKARNGASFNADEKEFLVNLYEAMWWGARVRGYKEAGQLADAYVNGGGQVVMISSAAYEGSTIVKTAQDVMKAVLAEHYAKSDAALTIRSTDQAVRTKIRELRRKKRFNQASEGELYANGILKAEENNLRLKYADNRFELQAASRRTGATSNAKTVDITWKVESKYDFESYESKPGDITVLPVVHPGTKTSTPAEAQKLLAEVFPEYMRVGGQYQSELVLPDGLSKYMVKEGVAKEFTYIATWTGTLEVRLPPKPGK